MTLRYINLLLTLTLSLTLLNQQKKLTYKHLPIILITTYMVVHTTRYEPEPTLSLLTHTHRDRMTDTLKTSELESIR